jgi:ABC-type Fe3+ transport system permease subunit
MSWATVVLYLSTLNYPQAVTNVKIAVKQVKQHTAKAAKKVGHKVRHPKS